MYSIVQVLAAFLLQSESATTPSTVRSSLLTNMVCLRVRTRVLDYSTLPLLATVVVVIVVARVVVVVVQ
jgi:hypothetical protein